MGGRANAALEEQGTTDKRAKLKESYVTAQAELETLKATRPVGELEALLAAARPVCRVHVTERGRQTVCTKPPALEAELERARQRERLKGTMEKASGELSKAGVGKVANSDAVALARYASDVGWTVDADYMNKLLALLAVLVIECGGGLSLALAMALSALSERLPNAEPFGRTQEDRTPDDRWGNATPNAGSGAASERSPLPNESVQLAPDARDKSAASVRLLAYLAERGGVLASSQLQLARSLGWSKTWTHEVLHELAGRGLVKLDARPTGTVVKLAA